ncbi:MAG: CDP-alcohol phosphatidyltransferase family protein, partial [Nitrospinales bacterium]
ETSYALASGAVFLYVKLYLDNIDGRLARARNEVSRFGRFFDSFADWIVTVLVYAAIAIRLVRETGDLSLGLLGAAAALSGFIHCSFYVFYLVHYASLAGTYENNRPDESFTSEDNSAYRQGEFSRSVYFLQRFHGWAYGWQDRLIAGLDRFSRKLAGSTNAQSERAWYGDKRFLTLASPLCLCTNNMAVVVFSIFNRLDIGLALIVGLGNLYWVGLSAWKIARFKLAGKDRVKK